MRTNKTSIDSSIEYLKSSYNNIIPSKDMSSDEYAFFLQYAKPYEMELDVVSKETYDTIRKELQPTITPNSNTIPKVTVNQPSHLPPITLKNFIKKATNLKIPKFKNEIERWQWVVKETSKLLDNNIYLLINEAAKESLKKEEYVIVFVNSKKFCYTYRTWIVFSHNNQTLFDHLYSLNYIQS